MILITLLILAAAFALFWTLKTKKPFPAMITIGMILGIVLTLILSKTLTPGIYVYLGFVVVSFFYGLTVKEKKLWPRIVITLMSAFIFVYWLWVLNHWHGNEMLAPIAVMLLGAVGLITKAKLKNEVGFLAILAADALTIILEHLMKAS
jgi:hypothetical protein